MGQHSLLDALMVLKLGNNFDVLPRLAQDPSDLPHTGSAADERRENHVHLQTNKQQQQKG